MAYTDNSGLYRKWGTERAAVNTAGEYKTFGSLREIEIKIDLTELTEEETVLSDTVFFPRCRIEEVEIVTHTVAATGTAVDIGLIRTDRSTEIDYNGFAAAFPIASMNAAGEKTVLRSGSSFAGALIGTTTTNVGHITASRTDSTAFTAGIIIVRIRYYGV
jgi:hypothetical protein